MLPFSTICARTSVKIETKITENGMNKLKTIEAPAANLRAKRVQACATEKKYSGTTLLRIASNLGKARKITHKTRTTNRKVITRLTRSAKKNISLKASSMDVEKIPVKLFKSATPRVNQSECPIQE